MNIIKTEIQDLLIIEPQVFGDNRGWFTETYSKSKFSSQGINIDFVQDNHSMSSEKGTLRGLHFQKEPYAQTKLVRCTKGEMLDVAVDLRKGSPTYKKWVSVVLSEQNKKQLLIPKGFAHGFLTLTDNVEVQYKVDEYYNKDSDRSIRFDDPDIAVDWGITTPILSDKDITAPFLKDSDVSFSLKFMVTGFDGQLGHDVVLKLNEAGIKVIAPTLLEFDLTNNSQVTDYILKQKPDVILHCAAYTAVDKAEDEKDLCYQINSEATKHIADACNQINATLVYISTDYVFDGTGDTPHDEAKQTSPVNYYGYTKELGEQYARGVVKHFIIRTSWLYGINGHNFVKTMLKLAETKKEISVVSDQIGAPTYSKDLAEFIVNLVQTDKYGTYHGVNDGYCSWYDFAKAIFALFNIDINVLPISSHQFKTKAKRPLNSRMSKANTEKIGLAKMPNWMDALNRYVEELKS